MQTMIFKSYSLDMVLSLFHQKRDSYIQRLPPARHCEQAAAGDDYALTLSASRREGDARHPSLRGGLSERSETKADEAISSQR